MQTDLTRETHPFNVEQCRRFVEQCRRFVERIARGARRRFAGYPDRAGLVAECVRDAAERVPPLAPDPASQLVRLYAMARLVATPPWAAGDGDIALATLADRMAKGTRSPRRARNGAGLDRHSLRHPAPGTRTRPAASDPQRDMSRAAGRILRISSATRSAFFWRSASSSAV